MITIIFTKALFILSVFCVALLETEEVSHQSGIEREDRDRRDEECTQVAQGFEQTT